MTTWPATARCVHRFSHPQATELTGAGLERRRGTTSPAWTTSRTTTSVKVTAGQVGPCAVPRRGRFYATADRCTHEEASLSDGWIQDGTIECPRHQGFFDIVSGKALTRSGDRGCVHVPCAGRGRPCVGPGRGD